MFFDPEDKTEDTTDSDNWQDPTSGEEEGTDSDNWQSPSV